MLRRSLDRAHARRSDEGFTLIELLIVIIILGVLAAIVVFSVTGITDKGNTAACNATVSEIDTAFEANVAQGGSSDATTVTLTDLKTFFHNSTVPKAAGTHSLTGATTVSAVDALAC